jgi:hypoxanthine phosphoribosyltransferase
VHKENSAALKIKKTVFSAEQIQQRVKELAKQVSHDYAGKTLNVVCVLENGFMFMSDFVRLLEIPVICQFVRPESKETIQNNTATTSIFYAPEVNVTGKDVLLIEALVQSGVTSEFLVRNFFARGAGTVKLLTLLDKQSERRVMLQPEYFGFLLDERFVVGYGLGAPQIGRNLPYIAAL